MNGTTLSVIFGDENQLPKTFVPVQARFLYEAILGFNDSEDGQEEIQNLIDETLKNDKIAEITKRILSGQI